MEFQEPSTGGFSDFKVLTPALDRLLDRMLVAVLVFLIPALFSSLIPVAGVGWGPKMGPELVVYVIVAGILLVRNRVSARVRATAFLAVALSVSCWDLVSWGLAGNGPVLFLVSTLMAALLFGGRGGALVLGLSAVAMLAIWGLWMAGWRRVDHDVLAFLASPAAWLTTISATLSLALVLLLCLRSIFESMGESFAALRKQTQDLEEANARLQEEMRERQRLEESLIEERRFSEGVIDSLPGGFYVYDQDGLLVRWNKNLEAFTGLASDELRRRHILDWFDGEDRAVVDEATHEAFEKGRTRCSVTVTRKDGVRIPYELIGQRLEMGGKTYLLGLGLDVADRKLREDEQARLATLVEQSPEGIIVTDPDGVIQYVNRMFERMTGYSAQEAIGRTPRILKSGQHDASFYREMWDTLLRGETWKGHIVNKNKQGRLYSEDATICPVRDSQGSIINYLAVKRDMTQQLAMETRLRQAQKMEAIGTLAGGIAHDFNNILTGILGYTSLAMGDIPETARAHKHLEQVTKAGRRATELVAQILTFSRQTEREHKRLFMHTITKEALKLLRASIPPIIDIRHDIDSSCGPVLADPTEMHQILMNLCTNAYQAMMEAGGVLSVALSQVEVGNNEMAMASELKPGPYLRLSVSDTGHGMTKETQARLFEPYFTTKARGEGTGLGLSTVHGIVQEAGGTIHVYSEAGKGSTFVVFLPVASSEHESEKESGLKEELLAGTERILFVDDEESNASFAKAALERLGYDVTTMADSREALALFRTNPDRFDVVITDQMMPGMMGTELSINMLAYRRDIPIILCTGFGDLLEGLRKEDMGIRDCVMKPVIASDLARAIRKVLDGGNASRA